jgi:dihydrolipoamide dehydrogenase
VVDSTALLSVPEAPKRLTVIGGGVIGVEFAGLFSALGGTVTVIEVRDEILPFMDRDQAPLLRRALRGVDFRLGSRVEKIEGRTVLLTGPGEKTDRIEADLILMAAGRSPRVSGWGAENAGLGGSAGGIAVDSRMRTGVPGIWAAGDLVGTSLLAHAAHRMGEVAAADILTRLQGGPEQGSPMRSGALPWAVYGLTEAAGVGLTAEEAALRGIPILSASVPMRFSGRFAAENTFAGQGAVKVIASAESRKLLGIHAVGAYASEFIWGGAALLEGKFSVEEARELIFPHPTAAELIRDALWEL